MCAYVFRSRIVQLTMTCVIVHSGTAGSHTQQGCTQGKECATFDMILLQTEYKHMSTHGIVVSSERPAANSNPPYGATLNAEADTIASSADVPEVGSDREVELVEGVKQRRKWDFDDIGPLDTAPLVLRGGKSTFNRRSYEQLWILGVLLLFLHEGPSWKVWFGNGQVEGKLASTHTRETNADRPLEETNPTHIVCGPPLSKDFAAGSVTALFQRRALQHPGKQAVIGIPRSVHVTYGDLESRVSSMADAFSGAGLGEGDAVAVLLSPSLQMIVAALACMRASVAWVPLDDQAPQERLKVQIGVVNPRLALVHVGYERAEELSVLMPVSSISASGALSRIDVLRARSADTLPAGVAAIFFTSGSTGTAKAVMYGHDTILHGVLSMVSLCKMDECSRLLVKTPIVWAVTEYELFSALVVGATAVVDPTCQRNVQNFARTIMMHQVSVVMTSAPVLQLLAQELDGSTHSLQHVVNVGAALPTQICVEARAALGTHVEIHNIYGCTETPCTQWTFTNNPDPLVAHVPDISPAGRPMPGVEVCVLDEHLIPVLNGVVGEICFGGPFLSKGYFRDEEETQKRFTQCASGSRIYRSGDIGCWIPDPISGMDMKSMVLQIMGRKDRQLNINGVRVSPEEVEALLMQLPHVQEASVVQAGSNESVAMVACLACKESPATADFFLEHCKTNFARHLRPERIIVMEDLPKLPNGKVNLVACEKLANANSSTQVVDSLGLMRSLAPAHLKAKHIADNVVAVSTLAMVFFHTFQTAGATFKPFWQGHFGSCFAAAWLRHIAIDWRESSEWSSMGFVFAGAYADALAPDRFKLGIREIVILLSYLVACVIHYPMAREWGGESLWYFPMLLMAKLLLMIFHKFKFPVQLQASLFLATPLAYPMAGYLPSILPTWTIDIFSFQCVFTQWKLNSLALYGLTFVLVPDILKPILAWHKRISTEKVSTIACILFLAAWASEVYFSGQKELQQYLQLGIMKKGLLLDFIIFLPLLGSCICCPKNVHMQWIAQNALGSYVSSCIFYGTAAWEKQDRYWVALDKTFGTGNAGATAQLFALILGSVVWCCVIGPATQWIMLAPVKVYMQVSSRP